MKINTERLSKFAELDDESLWSAMLGMADAHGHKIKAPMPSHEEMERIRRIFRGEEKIGMAEAIRVLNSYKKGDSKGGRR